MGSARGSDLEVVIYEEAIYAVAPTTPNGLKTHTISCGVKASRGHNQSKVLRNDRNPVEPSQGRKTVVGPHVIQPDSRSVGFQMKHALGSAAVAADSPVVGINTHTLKIGALPIGLTVDKKFGNVGTPGNNVVFRYLGCRYSDWSLSAADDGILEITFNVTGSDSVDDTVLLDAAPKLYTIQGFALPSLTFSEGGAACKIAKDFQFTHANNLDGEAGRTIGNNGVLSELPEGTVGVSFNFNLLFQNMTHYNKQKNATPSSFAITFPHKVANHLLRLKVNELLYELDDPIADGPNGVMVPMKGLGYYTSDAAASAVVVEIQNDVPNYTSIPA
jgi:hypothetical protein